MTDLETRVETALHELADRVIDDEGRWASPRQAGDALAPDPPGRRWLVWATAGLLVVGGVVATTAVLRRPAADIVLDPPAVSTITAPPTLPVTSVPATRAPATTVPPTNAPAVAELERPVWMIDPAVAGSPAFTMNRLVQWVLDDPMRAGRAAVRLGSDGVDAAVEWNVRPSPPGDVASRIYPAADIVDTADVRRWQADRVAVYYFPPADGVQLSATVPIDLEAELTPWLASLVAAGGDVDAVPAPPGFELRSQPVDTYTLNYEGPRPGPGPASEPAAHDPLFYVGLTTTRYDAPVALDVLNVSPGYPLDPGWAPIEAPFGIGEARKYTPADPDGPNSYSAAMLMWQPDPQTVVSLSAPREWIDELSAGLMEVEAAATGATEADPMWLGPAPAAQAFYVVLQGETPLGRFFYLAYTDADGNTCRALFGLGTGTSTCASDADWNLPPTALCSTLPAGYTDGQEGVLRQALVLVDADQVPFVEVRETPESDPVEPNVFTGGAGEHPWALIWASFFHDEPPSNTLGFVTFSGGTCAAPSSYRPEALPE